MLEPIVSGHAVMCGCLEVEDTDDRVLFVCSACGDSVESERASDPHSVGYDAQIAEEGVEDITHRDFSHAESGIETNLLKTNEVASDYGSQ